MTDHVLPFLEHLDGAGQVTLKWGFSNVFQNITFQLSVNTTGWVGFGLSPKGNMIGADIVIGGVESNGTYFKVKCVHLLKWITEELVVYFCV